MSDSHRHQIHGSSVGSNKRDGVEYVRYLLDGSGAENSVDFTMLRRDLESMSTPQTDFSDIHSPPVLTGLSSIRPSHRISHLGTGEVLQRDPRFTTPKSPIHQSLNNAPSADDDLSSSSFNSNKMEIESLNQSLKREGFDHLPNRIFAGLSRTVMHAVSAKFYEILSGHHFLRQKSEELNLKKNELNEQVLALVNDLEKSESAKIDHENQMKAKNSEILELKQRNSQLVQKLSAIDHVDFESAGLASTKDAALKKLTDEYERLESQVKKSREATESYIKNKLGRTISEEDSKISDLMQPLIDKNQELIKEIEELRKRYPQSSAKRWTTAKEDAAEIRGEEPETAKAPTQTFNTQPINISKPLDVYAKEISLLRKENEKLHLELASRPTAREWKIAQHRIKDLESEIKSKEKLGSSHQFTRKLIRNDKFHHMLDRNAQEVVNVHHDESSEIVKMVCLKLKLTDPYALVSTIDMLIEVVKYIPAMERFIREVDALVWSNDKVINEQGIPHRLTTTLANLKRYFKTKPGLQNLPPTTVITEDDPITASMIDHFKDLFDVESMEGIYPKMNEIYVYVQETKTGLRILSSLLGLDDNVSIVRILEESANFIRNYNSANINDNDNYHEEGNSNNLKYGNNDPLSVTGYESAFEASTTIQEILSKLCQIISDSQTVLADSHEALAIWIHALMEKLGFRFLGIGERGSKSETVLPSNWNSVKDAYCFRYSHPQSSITFLLKMLRMADQMIISGLGVEDGKLHQFSVNVKDYVVDHKGLLQNLDKALYIRPERLEESLLRDIVRKLVPGVYDKGVVSEGDIGSSRAVEERRPDPYPDPYSQGVRPMPMPLGQPPLRPMMPPILGDPYNQNPTHRNPFRIGDQDLDPLGILQPPRPGGGMFVGPEHPMFGGSGPGAGGVPFGVPPGARFDPISPFGSGSGNVPIRPGPRRDPYAGSGSGVHPQYPGEPDNDDFYPPGINRPTQRRNPNGEDNDPSFQPPYL